MDKDTKILIADENNEVRNHIREKLKVNGAGLIDEVKNGDEAMKMISRQAYDIVISDPLASLSRRGFHYEENSRNR